MQLFRLLKTKAILMWGSTLLVVGAAVYAEAVPVVANRPRKSARHERMLANPTFIEVNRRICFSLSRSGEIVTPEQILSKMVSKVNSQNTHKREGTLLEAL